MERMKRRVVFALKTGKKSLIQNAKLLEEIIADAAVSALLFKLQHIKKINGVCAVVVGELYET